MQKGLLQFRLTNTWNEIEPTNCVLNSHPIFCPSEYCPPPTWPWKAITFPIFHLLACCILTCWGERVKLCSSQGQTSSFKCYQDDANRWKSYHINIKRKQAFHATILLHLQCGQLANMVVHPKGSKSTSVITPCAKEQGHCCGWGEAPRKGSAESVIRAR